MLDKPRRDTEPIISRAMGWNIVGVGGFFTILLLAVLLYMERYDVTGILPASLNSLSSEGAVEGGLSPYELSLFFTIFVMLQFWNMFNAKAFMTGQSAFSRLTECRGFMLIALVIFVGQILIVELGGQMFNVTPLRLEHWLIIIASTSLVLWVGEAIRKTLRKPASA
jgi:Ca2+-transporting ATPase